MLHKTKNDPFVTVYNPFGCAVYLNVYIDYIHFNVDVFVQAASVLWESGR